ncbi:MAG: hypothetical protein U9N83_12605 [Thermodesulfobacteriota bacterium]|nr:hypothetical protein [Thermodesulfobacteriota bacterium]
MDYFFKNKLFKDMPLELCEQAIDSAVSLPDEFISEKDLYKEASHWVASRKNPHTTCIFWYWLDEEMAI